MLSRGFLPPPTLRRYCFSLSLLGVGISGSTISQRAFDTSHDFTLMCLSPLEKSMPEGQRFFKIIYG